MHISRRRIFVLVLAVAAAVTGGSFTYVSSASAEEPPASSTPASPPPPPWVRPDGTTDFSKATAVPVWGSDRTVSIGPPPEPSPEDAKRMTEEFRQAVLQQGGKLG